MHDEAAQVNSLLTTYGSPLYVFRQDDFADYYRHFVHCMQARYPNYRLAYSFKTNYVPYICRLVRELGGLAEVVSDMEYALAKRLDFHDAAIIYNGPVKGPLCDTAFLNGTTVNADSLEEIRRFVRLAQEHPEKDLALGLRLNLNVGQTFVSRFGIDATDENIAQAKALIARAGNLRVSGLHFHVSQARGLSAWRERARQMLRLAQQHFDDAVDFIDLGSGMYGHMEPALHCQFDDVPTPEAYAEAVAGQFAAHYQNRQRRPLLITEPGTTVVSSYMDMVTRVVAIKHIKGQDFIIVDTSKLNMGEIATLKALPYTRIPGGQTPQRFACAAVTGYTCLEHDVILRRFSGELAVGDTLIFNNVGGYSVVSKPPFIHPNCAMAAVTRTGESKLIKRAEHMDDIFQTYIF